MLSAATTSNQHQPNFWFPASPLPSFFSSTGGTDRNLYPPTNKHHFDTNACSSSSGSSPTPPDYLLSRTNTTLNLTQFNYIQQNHHPSSNAFLPRDDWSQITTSPTSWHPQHSIKGKEISFCVVGYSFMPSYCIENEVAQYPIHSFIFYVLMVIR
jgi:hypothetical protein